MPTTTPPLPVLDPHFHIWDNKTHPNSNLGELTLKELPVYSFRNYEEDCGVGVSGSVHVEAIVGQAEGAEDGLDPVAETHFVLEQLGAEGVRNVNLVVFVKLSDMPRAEAVIEAHRHVAGTRLVGVRMILNHSAEDPSLTWPQVERGDYLTGGSPSFKEGFALLGPRKLSFDLQVNWFQLQDAASFLQAFPDTVVILDHMGCLKLGAGEEEDARRITVWQRGMQALAALPNVFVKLSMLEYIRSGWQSDDTGKGEGDSKSDDTQGDAAGAACTNAHAVVKARVRDTIKWFGPSRCMFASNFPVDKCLLGRDCHPTSLENLVLAQHALVADLPEEEQRQLFIETARKVYKLK
ncbi:hypothetical protein NSK_000104 [Nannochloropsis salina CCMP1776]|jgi:predicted TIM-barrel fold metal-dependent hydrolase|uniref:Amidohydrolase-related domain-containing protein n=1 Tax=Nannochloropsis salina CCMP1776 TaxID=1027361 RepID=A0A4D9DAN4_9STRA|nr:hypothetical protein NSK_000104 [Nannochloropsis salina CCMP1776]|eukprot:TFJ88530.1 hypothetical protein NSK_000104 [Nannochloropsis salina CCMP1776]